MQEKYIEIMLKEADKAYKKGEIPVGAVLVIDDKIVAKAHNTKQRSHRCIDHAEIKCILKASKKLKDWRLDNSTLYVTLEPCKMCQEVIRQSRIKNVYYLVESTFKNEDKKEIKYEKIISREISEYKTKLSSFFADKR